MVGVTDPVDGGLLGHVAVPDDDVEEMTDQMAVKFRAVCDLVDQSECEANNCQASTVERNGMTVGAGIGWLLAGDADERTEWSPLVLVQRGLRVIAVCLTCGPEGVYDALWHDLPEPDAKPVHS